MLRKICIAAIFVALAASAASARSRVDSNGNLDSLIARHAAANNLPETLLRRVIKRESGGDPRVSERRAVLRIDASMAVKPWALLGVHRRRACDRERRDTGKENFLHADLH